MRLQDIMSTPVETIEPHDNAAAARAKLSSGGVQHLVVTRGRSVLGVVSTRDLRKERPDALVEELMSSPVVTAAPRTTVREAANLLRGNAVGCLPVVDRGHVVGIVTISDLLELIGRGVAKPIEHHTSWTMRGRGLRKPLLTNGM